MLPSLEDVLRHVFLKEDMFLLEKADEPPKNQE